MHINFRKPSAAAIVATTALVIAVGSGSAYAATELGKGSVTTRTIATHAVTHSKIARGAVTGSKLATNLKENFKGKTGPRGPRGNPGPQGNQGVPGINGIDATVPITNLHGTWIDHSDGTDGKSSVDSAGVELGGTANNGGLADSNDYAGISTNVLNGLTPADLGTITYTERYTMPTDSHYAAPYFKLKLVPTGGSCGDDDVVYNPSVQSDDLDYANETETYNVTAPYSTVGVNNDANPVDGSYPVAIHSPNNVGNEQICLAEIILGGGSSSQGAKATVSDVTFAGHGVSSRTYEFTK